MGFQLRCAVARIADDDEASQLIELARTGGIAAHRLREPFLGIAAAYDPAELRDRLRDELADGDDDDEIYERAEAVLDPLVAALPAHRFAIIDVDCFGGTCLYRGYTAGAGDHVQVATSSHGHQQLLAAIGVVDPPWYFAPFTRGFFATGREPEGPRRRATLCHVSGTLQAIPIALATTCAALVARPWQVISASERHVIIGHDELWLSLHAAGKALELRVTSYVDPATTRRLIDELVGELDGATAELVASDPDGAPRERWSLP